jgi:hypothetical protein
MEWGYQHTGRNASSDERTGKSLRPSLIHPADTIRCVLRHYIDGLRVSLRKGRPVDWQLSFPAYRLDVRDGELIVVNTCSDRVRRIRDRFDIGQLAGRLLLTGLGPVILNPVALG